MNKQNNPVAKFAGRFNKPATYRDKKKDLKRGYLKHKTPLTKEVY